MNIDLSSTFNHGDKDAMRHFFLDHYMVHIQTSQALQARFGGSFSTTGLMDALAEDALVQLMGGPGQQTPAVLFNWLILHNIVHQVTEQRIVTLNLNAPDLSIVDFSQADQFYDWMFVHQELHDFEQQALGLR